MTDNHADVNPESLRAFADELAGLAQAIRSTGADLDAGLARLGRTFQDDHFYEFQAVFGQARQKLIEFADEITGLLPILRQDADDIADSQRQRLE